MSSPSNFEDISYPVNFKSDVFIQVISPRQYLVVQLTYFFAFYR